MAPSRPEIYVCGYLCRRSGSVSGASRGIFERLKIDLYDLKTPSSFLSPRRDIQSHSHTRTRARAGPDPCRTGVGMGTTCPEGAGRFVFRSPTGLVRTPRPLAIRVRWLTHFPLPPRRKGLRGAGARGRLRRELFDCCHCK